MLNKKILSVISYLLLVINIYMYSESNKLNVFDSVYPHETFVFNSNRNITNKCRMQMQYPYYSYYVNAKECKYVECFPNLEMGITPKYTEEMSIYIENKYTQINCSHLYIFPNIILNSENLKNIFSFKRTEKETGYIFNCTVLSWEVYEKGLSLDVVVKTSYWGLIEEHSIVYFELKEDGKYYETENANSLGKLKKHYSASDFFCDYLDDVYLKYFSYDGCTLFKIKGFSKIDSVLANEIIFYNRIKEGIEFITPYGCGFFDFETESVSLVSKEKYIGKEFNYFAIFENHDFKGEKRKKNITEADLNPPSIKLPLEEKYLMKNAMNKQK